MHIYYGVKFYVYSVALLNMRHRILVIKITEYD